ncbi:hypothetical protein ES708_00539 [subsurface metagenome]
MNKKEYQDLKDKAAELRKYIILMNCYAGSGHPGGSLSAVEMANHWLYNTSSGLRYRKMVWRNNYRTLQA